jgi:hypothetical protein
MLQIRADTRRRASRASRAVALAIAIACLPTAGALGAASTIQQLAVPAYFDPALTPALWDRVVASPRGSIAVANPSSGPGAIADPAYLAVLERAHSAGVRVLGYVDAGFLGTTGRTTRGGSTSPADWIAQVEADVETWYRLYGAGLDGIFLDDEQNLCADAPAYEALETFIEQRHSGALVAANPGSPVPRCYESTADLLLTFEGDYAAYRDRFAGLDWTPSDPSKIWHVVYGATDPAATRDAIELSKRRGAGYVYVTDATVPNPYDALPSDWPDELAAVSSALTGPALMSVTDLGRPGAEPLVVAPRGTCGVPLDGAQANGAPSPCGPGAWPAIGSGDWVPLLRGAGGDTVELRFAQPVGEVKVSATTNLGLGLRTPDGTPVPNVEVLTPQAAQPTADRSVWRVTLPALDPRPMTFSVVAQDVYWTASFALGLSASAPAPPGGAPSAPPLAPPRPRPLAVTIGGVAQPTARAISLQLDASDAATLAVRIVGRKGATVARRTIRARRGRHWVKLPLAAGAHGPTRGASLRGQTVQVVVASRGSDARLRVTARRRVRARP